jgi:ABC-type cobalamin/Fe3+-siderophores transport system ATPase subunit
VQDAPVILLDEPFNALDTRTITDLLVLCAAGMARAAPSWPCCTTSNW